MRILALALLLATPAVADEPAYDPNILTACLDRTAGDTGNARVCIGEASTACMAKPGGDTTVGMGNCLAAETKDWDALLNREYTRLLKRAEEADADLVKLGSAADPAAPVLKQSQRDWIAFRDSSCRYEAVRFQGGTAGGPASANCMMQLTGEQALRLRDMGRDNEGAQ
ncbi:lysozyme inhibitor LprI family protein [Paracoccus sp. CPCC 101403]|uniref:Lysozyme inhibitor LprI family protein n=1 Tax=Paracoccus broussonetiae TaxID=3075834 RepID=A0ABU3EBP5_9RHOB|nr:lysozyme inhibitor LprI family protein [Paracoccus sp. CPCC 101403]MDT1061643.1 lysozyme inhibitor LprI family protein [Paracoccus sp. CPCC 101403]